MRYLFLTIVFLFMSCTGGQTEPVFVKVESEESGVFFANVIKENDSLNIMDYEYLYNGGGVGIGDFNLDGKPDIFFTGNMTSSRLYINKGDFKFTDMTQSAGVATNTWCTGVSVVDINADGKDDIHVATGMDTNKQFHPNYFFINMTEKGGPVKFENKVVEMGLTDSLYTIQAAWLDYDKDNDLDLFLIHNALEDTPKNAILGQRTDGSGKSTDKLYRNEGLKDGTPLFTDVSEEAGILIEGWSLGVTVSDFNNDDYPDLYVANDFLSNDLLYINQRDGTFKNKILDYVRHQSHNSMGIDIADINNDAAPDLVILDMFPEDNLRQKTMFPDISFENYHRILEKGYQPQYVRNMLQVNNGNGTFSEIGNFSGISATDWSWSPLLADYDNDGKRDLYITNGYVKEITDLDFVDHYNKGSVFGTTASKRKMLVNQLNAMKGVKKPNFYYQNKGGNRFENRTPESGLEIPSFSNGAAYADLDSDGDLDLVVSNINEAAFLFKNQTIQSTSSSANYVRLKMPADAQSFGSKISVYTEGKELFAEHYTQRGYLSSMENIIHFGLGDVKLVDSIRIKWPSGKQSLLTNVTPNQVLRLTWSDFQNATIANNIIRNGGTLVQSDSALVSFNLGAEKNFKGFNRWPLHFRGYDRLGPDVAVGDVNGDHLDDFFCTGSAGISGSVFLQQRSGGFVRTLENLEISRGAETNASVFFDADSDGDLDLYCANGSSEHIDQKQLWQDALYFNDGYGKFERVSGTLPFMETITTHVTPLDFDNDGDIDLFVGGRVLPDTYPEAPRSYLLRNDHGTFKDCTASLAPDILRPGMVTGSLAEDINEDGWIDLIVVGEYMPIQIYYNHRGTFYLDKTVNGLEHTHGWWNCVKAADFDKDGDTDFVVGNWGLNNFFKASQNEPISIYANDYDQNGTIEPIMTYYIHGKEYIAHPRNTLLKRLPGLRNSTSDYASYGKKTAQEILGRKALEGALNVKAYELASIYVKNLGKGKFTIIPLPSEAQWAPIFDFEITDLNADGWKDVLMVGNYFDTEVLTGRYDAGSRAVLRNKNGDGFEPMSPNLSGWYLKGEARNIAGLKIASGDSTSNVFLVAKPNEELTIFRKKNSSK